MTAIRQIEIRHFRAIRHLRWCPNPGINCLIGPGDGGKSTILDAIDLTLGARQNFTFTDADFHRCDITRPIIIDVTIGDLSDDLLNLETYGHFFCGWDSQTRQLHNETSAALETVLTLRLRVEADLEPYWSLYSEGAGAEGREGNLRFRHRQNIAPTRLGAFAAHHMALGPRSVLNKVSTDAARASAALAEASRQARHAFAERGCEGVEDVLRISGEIAQSMGIRIEEIRALLDVRGVTFSGGAVGLHDGDHVPMRTMGSGSTRLLVAGLQKQVGQSSIFLIDEVEFGLEPYRIVRLLDSLGAKNNDQSQQVFLTTHSPVVLRELSAQQLHAVRKSWTEVPDPPVYGVLPGTTTRIVGNHIFPLGPSEEAQKTLRACAEAFLAPSVIVCEGKTEIGLIRGFDLYGQAQGRKSVLAEGVHWADGGGSSMMERTRIFASMGYRTALFMDSDVQYSAQDYGTLTNLGVAIFRYPEPLSTEGALFSSIAAHQIGGLLAIACDWRTEDSVNAKIQRMSNNNYSLQTCRDGFVDAMRPTLGAAAGDGKWFKDIDPAERAVREVVAPHWSDVGLAFRDTIEALWRWIRAAPTAVTVPQPQTGGQ